MTIYRAYLDVLLNSGSDNETYSICVQFSQTRLEQVKGKSLPVVPAQHF